MSGAHIDAAATEWRRNWTLVMAATSGVALSAISVSSIGVMMEPLEQEFGWTRTQISSGPSLISFIAMALGTAVGIAIDRIGARLIGIVVAALMCGAVALMSSVSDSLWHWWALWALVGLAASAMPTVWLLPVSSLFVKGRGLAMAVALSGSGISTSLVPILAHYLVENHGWRGAYVGMAAIWGLVALPLILLFFRGPEGRRKAAAAAAAAPDGAAAVELPGVTAREGFRSATFYKMAFASFFAMVGGVALILNIVPVLTFTGLSRGTAAGIAGLLGISTIIGRLVGGWLMDRMSASVLACGATAGATILPASLLLFPGSATVAGVALVLYGMFGGVKIPAIAYLASRHFGARSFGTLYGTINAAVALAVASGPLAASYIYDVTRSYTPVMWAAIPALVIAGLLFATLGKYPEFKLQPPEKVRP